MVPTGGAGALGGRWSLLGAHVDAIGLTSHDASAALLFGGRLCAESAEHGQISVQPAGQMVVRTRSAQPSGISPSLRYRA
jgi:hypothetical protein